MLAGSLCLGASGLGCNAFSEAIGKDGGPTDGSSELTFEPRVFILQGETERYTITFSKPPPWVGTSGGRQLLTGFRFVAQDDPSQTFDDVERLTRMLSADQYEATLQAYPDAETNINRLLVIDLVYEITGQPQQLYSGVGRFWVLPSSQNLPDGDGGGDGGGDGRSDGGDR